MGGEREREKERERKKKKRKKKKKEVEEGRRVCHIQIHIQFKASLGYVRPCLKYKHGRLPPTKFQKNCKAQHCAIVTQYCRVGTR